MTLSILLWLAVFAPSVAIPNGMLISIPIVALILIFVKRTRGPTFSAVFRSIPVSLAVGALAGAAMHFAMNPLFDLLARQVTGAEPDLSSLAAVHGDLGNYLKLLALGVLFGGIIEELIDRGFLLGWGTAEFGEAWAIPLLLLTSLGFGLAHAWQGTAGMITTGLSGLCYGAVYLLCDRKLLPAVTMHATSNAIAITAIYLYGVQ
ncbi:CPBP family intramembrane glutamic endopeptidase [Pelagerythrobacter marensis]|uniref:CPBP family intramembrane glutamic endopeptidase n=1 Tax=Pelagerythrobacter marensis TaxID=543877 RepID=A0ABZ2D3T0_9SPHN